MVTYLLETSVGFLVFYGLYHLIFAKLTFFRLNRVVLLASLLFTLFFPWLTHYVEGLFSTENPLGWYAYMADEVVILAGQKINTPIGQNNSWFSTLTLWVYSLGIVVVLLRLLYGLVRVFYLYHAGNKHKLGAFTVVETKQNHLPFSFFHVIFLQKYDRNDTELQTIIKHETVHAREWHSLDILFLECIQVVYWFLPVIPLYKRAVRQVHECLADEGVCMISDRTNYIRVLLQGQNLAFQVRLGNQFFQSQIKQRLDMMTKKKSQGYARLMYVLFLPVAVGLLMGFGGKPLKGNPLITNPAEVAVSDTVPAPPPPPVPASARKGKISKATPVAPVPPVPEAAEPAPPPPPPPSPASMDRKEVFNMVDEMPRFQHEACESMKSEKEKQDCSRGKFMEYLSSHLTYPEGAKRDSLEGMVVVQFVVDTKGRMVDFVIVRDLGAECGQAVQKALQPLMGKNHVWIPGKQKGKAVNVLYTVPVRFKLD